MDLWHLIYFIFCAGFSISYVQKIEKLWDKIGVSIIAFIFCPFLLAIEINEYLEKQLDE